MTFDFQFVDYLVFILEISHRQAQAGRFLRLLLTAVSKEYWSMVVSFVHSQSTNK